LIPEKFTNNYAFLGNHKAIAVTVNGHRIFLDTRDYRNMSIITNGIYEEAVEWTLRKKLKGGHKVIDVGAHLGYHTLVIASIVGQQGIVFSLEPNPGIFKMLYETVMINGYKDFVKVFQKAALDKSTKLQFIWNSDHPQGAHVLLSNIQPTLSNIVEVDTVLLDDIAAEHLPINLIKIDAEGVEPLALNGAKKILSNSPDLKIIMEWNIPAMKIMGTQSEKLADLLKSYDFKVERIQRTDYRTGRLDHIEFEELSSIPICNLLLSK